MTDNSWHKVIQEHNQKLNEAKKRGDERMMDRHGFCTDHRDKPTGQCPLCEIERLRAEIRSHEAVIATARAEERGACLSIVGPSMDNCTCGACETRRVVAQDIRARGDSQ